MKSKNSSVFFIAFFIHKCNKLGFIHSWKIAIQLNLVKTFLLSESLKGIDANFDERNETEENESIGINNTVAINSNILATGVFTSAELYKLSKGKPFFLFCFLQSLLILTKTEKYTNKKMNLKKITSYM